MSKFTDAQLRAILAAEKADALSADSAGQLSTDRQKALDYYNGDMSDDMPVPDGRSKAVSSDVSDTVEGMMPQLMEIFCGGEDVVKFDPVSEEDVAAAEQETDYINHVFMQQNQGFLVLYSFIKDALLSKNGYVKVWWEESENDERETLLDQPDDVLALLASDPNIEIVEHTVKPAPGYEQAEGMSEGVDGEETPLPSLHDLTIAYKKKYSCAKVEGVPPEEFGISRHARSIRETNYCFHEPSGTTEAELIAQGYDEDQVKALPSYAGLESSTESKKRDTVGEADGSAGDESLNTSQRVIRVTEHYIRMDYDGSGRPGIYRVTTGGEQGEILSRDGVPAVERVNRIPFASMTPIIVTHRHYGKSVADLVMDIQRIKTALLRGALDNLYLHNNPRVEVAEANAGPNTLDDLLVARPGGIVRTKTAGGVQWQVVPDITGSIYPALQYMDATREWRTGITRQGQGIDADALQNQSATAVNQVFTAAQARIKLIARIFAETGIRDMFALLHATIRENGSQAETARLRNKWVTVDPREWKSRNDMTINVGLGTGGKQQQLAMFQMLVAAQQQAVAAGLVSRRNFYNSAQELVKLLGRKDPETFFTAPDAQPNPNDPASAVIEPAQDPKLIELQAKNEIEKTQAQADIATQRDKMQMESMLAREKHEQQMKQAAAEHHARMQEMQAQLAVKLASASSKKSVGPNGEVVESGPDFATIETIINKLKPKKPAVKITKLGNGQWLKEEVEAPQ